MIESEEVLTLTQVAERAGVHRRTVRAWIATGRLPAYQTVGGHWRVRAVEFAALPLTATQFARAVGVCPRTAMRWAARGAIAARKTPRGWAIPAHEVERVRARGAAE